MWDQTNITRIKAVYNALGTLGNQVVFVGGATLSLYAQRAAEIRPTEDVDILIELWAYAEYAAVEQRLRDIGFVNDQESCVICRYQYKGGMEGVITVDVMATGEDVLGFTNKWYPDGFKYAIDYAIDPRHTVRILSAPYFLATKLEAFKSPDRADNNNGTMSSDFEDIIFLLEYRESIWEEMNTCETSLREYLQAEFKQHMKNPLFEEWVDAHAGYSYPPATYMVLNRLKQFLV